MKKILFISNITKKITNFSIPSIKAAQAAGYEFHMASNFSNFDEESNVYQVITHHIDLDRNPLSKKNLNAFKQMLDLIKNEEFDAIHCNTPIGGLMGRICGRIGKVPKIIYTAHGFHFYQGAPLLSHLLYKTAEKWMARYTDVLITINEEDFNISKKFRLRESGRVYNLPGVGINTKDYQNNVVNKNELRKSFGIEEESIVLISMGDLIKRKNYSASMGILAEINNPSVYLLICGQGPEKENLMKIAKDKGIDKQVLFLGFRNDIKELLTIADIFLFTTLQEGLPRSTMEAMAAGLPCVVSDVRGNTDLITESYNGFLSPPNNVMKFASQINELILDKDLREKMGRNNIEVIKEYDVENILEKMSGIYKEVLD